MKPLIFHSQPKSLLKKTLGIKVVDFFEDQLEELFLIRNPRLKFHPEEAKQQFAKSKKGQGKWVYFPWNNTLVHILAEQEFYELRVSRNHNLITKVEQEIFRNFKIGIAGLSVGNSAALCLALEGTEYMRLADFDELSLSNLNRIRGSITQLGLNKASMTARQIYELNPYAKLDLFRKGIKNEKLLKKFIADPPRVDLLIDETDDVIIKIQLRLLARRLRIPVLSAADNGDNTIVDIERFDLEPKRELFHGLLGKIELRKFERMSFRDKIKPINDMVGIEYVTSRMKQSLLQVGSTLYAWPQLGGAAMLSGAAIAFLVKNIAFGEKLESGKYDVSLDRIFNKSYDSTKSRQRRKTETKEFLVQQNRIFS